MADQHARRGPPRYLIVVGVLVVASIVGAIGIMTSRSDTVAPCEPPDEPATEPGLIQQIEVFEDRRAPDFALRDVRDSSGLVQLSASCGRPTLLVWVVERDCPACADALEAVANADAPSDLTVIVIGPDEDAPALTALVDPILPNAEVAVDEDDEVSAHYGLRAVPLAIMLNEDHRIEEILDNPVRVATDLPAALADLQDGGS